MVGWLDTAVDVVALVLFLAPLVVVGWLLAQDVLDARRRAQEYHDEVHERLVDDLDYYADDDGRPR